MAAGRVKYTHFAPRSIGAASRLLSGLKLRILIAALEFGVP